MNTKKPAGLASAESKAKKLVRSPQKTYDAAEKADQKARKSRTKLGEAWTKLTGFIRMAKAWSKGDYKKVSLKTMIIVVAGVLYFLNPFDIIPDFIPLLGYLDDVTVIGFIANAVSKDVEKFLDWELANNT